MYRCLHCLSEEKTGLEYPDFLSVALHVICDHLHKDVFLPPTQTCAFLERNNPQPRIDPIETERYRN